MSILGIDYGAKKIGLAISDEQNKMALPLQVLFSQGREVMKKQLLEICQARQVEKIVVGVPVSMKSRGNEILLRDTDRQNKQMQEVLNFIDWLKTDFNLPIAMEDERLSTKLANGLRKDLVKKGPDDAVAAMLILQSYLDKMKNLKITL